MGQKRKKKRDPDHEKKHNDIIDLSQCRLIAKQFTLYKYGMIGYKEQSKGGEGHDEIYDSQNSPLQQRLPYQVLGMT